MGNQPTKQSGKPKKAVHWKSAEPPSPPGKPMLVPGSPNTSAPDVVTLRWKRPTSDGGSPILGYIIEHRRTGSPHWVRATAQLIQGTELSLSGLEPGWRYQFRVTAQNIVGQSECSELSDALTVTLQRAAVAPPRFVQELYDTTAIENEKIEFRVSVAGTPTPQISWYKDGFEIFSSRRTKIITEADMSILVIHQTALTDEGEFKCTATNRAGHAVTICSLSIDAYPKIRLPRQYEEGLIVEADEVIRLKVGIAGNPIPIVEWSHNGELIPSEGRYEIETNDKNSSLRIANAQRSDRGEYNLRAYNKLGEDYASFLVTVTAKPEPPGKVHINVGLGKAITLTWAAPEDDGGCKIGNYIVEYYRVGWDVWLKATTCRQLTTTLSGLFEGSQYRFRVKAENPYGLSEPSEESDTLFIPDPKRGINSATQIPEVENKENEPLPQAVPRKRREASRSPSRETEQIKKVKAFTPETYSRDEIVREMSYGTRDEDFFRSKQPTEPPPTAKPPAVIITEPAPIEQEPPQPAKPPQRPQSFSSPLMAMQKFSKEASPFFSSTEKVHSDNQLSPTGPPQQQQQPATSPTSEDGKSPTMHNSSEFMLVLYNEQEAKNNKGNSTFDFELEDLAAPPPPLSLSAPELNVEPPPPPKMRPAVSSTELLYERAMARFYQAVAMEESENQRKEAERRRSMSAAAPQPTQQETAVAMNRLSDRRSSLRRRLSGDKEAIVKQSSFESQHSSAVDDVIPEEKEEVLVKEEEKQTYQEEAAAMDKIDSALEELDEQLSISSSMDSMLEELKRRESARSSRSRIMSDDEEMETYHPGPRLMSPYRNPDPSQAIEVLTKPLPMPDPNFVPKPILKRPSTEILTKDEKDKKVAPSKPERKTLISVFDRKSPAKEEQAPLPEPTKETTPTPTSEVEQQKPEPPESEKQNPTEQEITTAIKTEAVRQRRLESRQNSIEESRAVADFYSDMVQQVEAAKKPRQLPLYMNPDDVRKLNDRTRSRDNSRDRVPRSRSGSESPMPVEDVYRLQKSRSPSLTSEQIVTKGKPAKESRILRQRSVSIDADSSRPSSAMKEQPPSPAVPTTRPDAAFNPSGVSEESTRRSRPMRESTAISKKRNVSQTRSRSSSAVRGDGSAVPEKTPIDVARRNRLRSASKSPAALQRNPILQPPSGPEPTKPAPTPVVRPTTPVPPTEPVTPSPPPTLPSEKRSPSPTQANPEPPAEEASIKSSVSYLTDVALFILACWLYLFKNPKLAVPVIILIMYRHISDAIHHRMPPWMKRTIS